MHFPSILQNDGKFLETPLPVARRSKPKGSNSGFNSIEHKSSYSPSQYMQEYTDAKMRLLQPP